MRLTMVKFKVFVFRFLARGRGRSCFGGFADLEFKMFVWAFIYTLKYYLV